MCCFPNRPRVAGARLVDMVEAKVEERRVLVVGGRGCLLT